VQRVLVEGHARRSAAQLSGKTSNNNTVNFAGPAYLIGRLVDVRITADAGSSLRGELAPEGQAVAANWT
jgi:tRNA-2-methylthio-N6-dimethylallyladenosine synthase